jgi:hypothetical protein
VERRILVLVLALGAVLTGFEGSASAAVAALERAGGATGFTSANKSLAATCSPGKRVLGVGADIGSGAGQVGIVEMIPNATLTGATVRAVEDGNGYGGDWSLGASALCATPVPGLQRVVATSPTNSISKGVIAACPAGKRLLGTGASIGGGGGRVVLRELIPNSALTSVSAFAAEDETNPTANWTVSAYAICANAVGGLQRVVAASPTNSTDGKSAVAACAAGKRVTGVGGELRGSGGQVRMDDLIPFPDPAASVQVIGIEDENGTTANWSAIAYAICVNSSERVVASATGSNPISSVMSFCAGDKAATGVGGDISGGFGEVTMFDLTRAVNRTEVQAAEDQTGTANTWVLRAYALCSTPLPGIEVVEAASSLDSGRVKTAVASCPVGKRVVAAAGAAFGAAGQVVMDQLVPNAGLTNVTVQAQEDEDQTALDWQMVAYAVCANPPPGLQRTSVTSEQDSEEIKTVSASCPAGKTLLGTGAAIVDGLGGVVIDDLRPNALLTDVTVTGIEDETGYANAWSATAYAICASA